VRVAIDPQGQIVSVTTSAAQLFGWAVAELAGQRVEVLFRRS
jgi:PAS domain S-box-containing protein